MSKRLQILMLVHRVPYPPNRGDRIRSFHLLKFLAQRASVSLATLADEPLEAGASEALQSLCHRVAIEPLGKSRWLRAAASLAAGRSATEGLFHSPRLRNTIRNWSRTTRFDAVVVFCSSMVQPRRAGIGRPQSSICATSITRSSLIARWRRALVQPALERQRGTWSRRPAVAITLVGREATSALCRRRAIRW
jgi:hypothetical protein